MIPGSAKELAALLLHPFHRAAMWLGCRLTIMTLDLMARDSGWFRCTAKGASLSFGLVALINRTGLFEWRGGRWIVKA